MANIFNILLNKAAKEGIGSSKTKQARDWFRTEASSIKQINPNNIIAQSPISNSSSPIGKMFLFRYSPKTANKLPYYDRFPLVFPFAQVSDGFYGINMHYLSLPMRAMLMDGLYDYVIDSKYEEKIRVRMSYQMLSSVSKLKYFKPCIKHYLNSQIETDMAQVPANLWDIALFLPLERFSKASKYRVYVDSRKAILQR